MTTRKTDTLIVGGGQAGLAMSARLSKLEIPHLVLERDRLVERWRTSRWDSLMANGPAWHDRFPDLVFPDTPPDGFPSKDDIVSYFERFATEINAPVLTGVDVQKVRRKPGTTLFEIVTSEGLFEANRVVAATGAFQDPVIPPLIPGDAPVRQLHSSAYRNPDQLSEGAVLVVGSGSSGAQIADELRRAGREVYLSVGPHDRPPRQYRGRDFVWWLGVLGKWDRAAPTPGTEHVTIAVSGARGGETVDFREFASRGIVLLGRTAGYADGSLSFEDNLSDTLTAGDANYLSLLDEADAYIAANGLNLPQEPEARRIGADPDCVQHPILSLDLERANVASIIWATGYKSDYSWLNLDAACKDGHPVHQRGVSDVAGLYFLGLPWQSRRGSSFIWGVWHDARYLADQIAIQRSYMTYHKDMEQNGLAAQ